MKRTSTNLFLLAAATLAAASSASAVTWSSTIGGDWATPANWGGTAPISGNSLIFGGTAPLQTLSDTLTSASFSITGITFNNTGTYTIGGNAFLLNGGITTTAASGTQTINNAITLGATQTITASNGTTIALGGIISGSGFGLTKQGAGTLILTGANSYNGGTTVSVGTLQIGDGTTNAAITGAVSIASGATLRLQHSGTVPTSPTFPVSWSTITGAGTLAFNSPGTAFANNSWSTAAGLTTTFTGTVLVERGNLRANSSTHLGSASQIVVKDGGQFSRITTDSFSATKSFFIEGNGAGEPGQESALRLGNSGQSVTVNGTITLTGNATIGAVGGAGAISTLAGVIGESGGARNLTFGTSSENAGIYNLTAVNTYTGNTNVAAGTFNLTSSGGLMFVIGLNGVNNKLTGLGTASIDGDFTLNLNGAGTTLNDSWTLVDVATKSFTSGFSIVGFTDDLDNTWSRTNSGITYDFSESTGILSVTAVPEPAAALLGSLGLLALLRRRRN